MQVSVGLVLIEWRRACAWKDGPLVSEDYQARRPFGRRGGVVGRRRVCLPAGQRWEVLEVYRARMWAGDREGALGREDVFAPNTRGCVRPWFVAAADAVKPEGVERSGWKPVR